MRRLDIDQPLDPYLFLCAAFREFEGIVYKTTAALSALALLLTAADLARFDLVDERGVTYSKYFQFQEKYAAFADLDRVEVRCVMYGPDNHGKFNLGFDYLLVKDGAFKINLLEESDLDGLLPRLEKLDAELTGLGIEVTRAPTAGFLQGNRSSFVTTCAEEIAERYDPDVTERLTALLRVSEFSDAIDE